MLVSLNGALAGSFVWLIDRKHSVATEHFLKIRDLLAGAFRGVLRKEVLQVLKDIDDRLPSELTSLGRVGERSRFDYLCGALAEYDETREDASVYQAILVDALASSISRQAERILDGAFKEEHGTVQIWLDETAIADLVTLASIMRRASRYRALFQWGRKWGSRVAILLTLSFVAIVAGTFFNSNAAQRVINGGLIAYGMFSVALIICVAAGGAGLQWLQQKSDGSCSGRELLAQWEG